MLRIPAPLFFPKVSPLSSHFPKHLIQFRFIYITLSTIDFVTKQLHKKNLYTHLDPRGDVGKKKNYDKENGLRGTRFKRESSFGSTWIITFFFYKKKFNISWD